MQETAAEMLARYAEIRKRTFGAPRSVNIATAPPPKAPKRARPVPPLRSPSLPPLVDRKRALREEIAELELKRAQLAVEVSQEVRRKTSLGKEIVALEGEVKRLQEDLLILENLPVTKARILRAFSRYTGFSIDDLKSRRRHADLALVRQACCYWMVRRTRSSFPEIARFLGNRDHTTILHSVKVYPAKRAQMGRHLRELEAGDHP